MTADSTLAADLSASDLDLAPAAEHPLWAALGGLDLLLAQALTAGTHDPRLTAVHRPDIEVAATLLEGDPGGPALRGHRDVAGTGTGLLGGRTDEDPWLLLGQAFGLDRFDLDVLLLALAPAVDLRYRAVYTALGGATDGWPTVALTLSLLCEGPDDRLARMGRFCADAPLVGGGVVQLLGPDDTGGHMLRQGVRPDAQVVRLLCGAGGLDHRLAGVARLEQVAVGWADLPLDAAAADRLARIVDRAAAGGAPCRLRLAGPAGAGGGTIARAVATRTGTALLVVDGARLATAAAGTAAERITLAFRQAWLWGQALLIDAVDALADDRVAWGAFCEALAAHPGLVMIAGGTDGSRSFAPALGVVTVPVGVVGVPVRRRLWAARLAAHGVCADAVDLDQVAERFRLGAEAIAAAAAQAVVEAGPLAAPEAGTASQGGTAQGRPPHLRREDLFAAARRHSRGGLGGLARRVAPRHGWADLVLPDDALGHLREICARVALRERVLGEWGFERTAARGSGTAVLFTGPPGTGKTTAAEVVAGELGLDLFAIDLSAVVSKYIGETEKNLERVFAAAEGSTAVLLFDEADALFGRRSVVRDAHDRYANVEVSFLLQRLESYDGVALLTSNQPGNLDEAFTRRLAATIHFPFPDEDVRRRIWAQVWPAQVPLADGLDLGLLARYRLSGGSIRNVAVAAAFLAAARGEEVSMTHVLQALRREHQKLGRAPDEHELHLTSGEAGTGDTS